MSLILLRDLQLAPIFRLRCRFLLGSKSLGCPGSLVMVNSLNGRRLARGPQKLATANSNICVVHIFSCHCSLSLRIIAHRPALAKL